MAKVSAEMQKQKEQEFRDNLVNTKIVQSDISDEMRRSFLDYSMSVIISRAIPDVRDGLKPVHRRIVYTMHENGLTPEKAYRKPRVPSGRSTCRTPSILPSANRALEKMKAVKLGQ